MPTAEAFKHRLIDIPMLHESECTSIVEQLDELQHRWITRSLATFHTLGRATYLDVRGTEPAEGAFRARLKSDNYLIHSNFKPLLRVLRTTLREVLGGEISLTTEFAIPGFHIFKGIGVVTPGKAPPHFDMQYKMLNWEGVDEAEPISFTLPVRLPQAGGGLDVWTETPDDIQALFRSRKLTSIHESADKLGPAHFHRYKLGHLTVHLDRIFHRIGSVADIVPTDERITLQGHGRKLNGVWHLYW
jgi:hypothetical protein